MAGRAGARVATLLICAGLPGVACAQGSSPHHVLRLEIGPPPGRPTTAAAAEAQIRGHAPRADLPARPLPATDKRPAAGRPEGVGPPETLAQAWATALAVDQSLEAARWNVSSAEESVRAARARRWPSVAMEGSYVGRTAEPAFRFEFDAMPLPANRFSYAQDENAVFRLTADWPLYTSGRIRHGIDAAEADLTSTAMNAEEESMELMMRVAEQYVAVLRARRDLEVAECAVRSLEAHTRDVATLFRHEQVARNDLLAAEVTLSNARQAAIQAHHRLDASRAAYNRGLGRALDSPVRLAELPVEDVREGVESLTSRAIRLRPAMARLTARAGALEHQAAALEAANRPQVQLRGEYAFEENRFSDPEGIGSLGVGVSWNVFDGGRNRHRAAALLHRAESVRRAQADLRSRIALDVRRAWLDIQETRRRIEVTREACRRADENLRVARQRYSLGAGTNTEVLDAETLRAETYRNFHSASHDAVLAVLRLRRATGELQAMRPPGTD